MHQREREITDTLVELLIATVRRIGARAERKVCLPIVAPPVTGLIWFTRQTPVAGTASLGRYMR